MGVELGLAAAERGQHRDDDQLALARVEGGAGVHVAERMLDDPVAEHAHPGEELRAARLVTELPEARQPACSAVIAGAERRIA